MANQRVEDSNAETRAGQEGSHAGSGTCHLNAATCEHDGTLEVGKSCVPSCDPGYQVSGEFTCYISTGGDVAATLASCDPVVSLLEAPETPKSKKLMRSAK